MDPRKGIPNEKESSTQSKESSSEKASREEGA
jgi:hypothetical protein